MISCPLPSLPVSSRPKSSCCVGVLAKSPQVPDRTPKVPQKRNSCRPSRPKKRQWSSSSEAMENDGSISHSLTDHPTVNEDNKSADNVKNDSFINQAAIAWNETRRQWVGDPSKKAHKPPREPIISWCTTYEELLSTSHPFPQPIALSEMVDFLVDIWQEEGLYD